MYSLFTKKEGSKGFTLIELLVVIAIIGLLSSVVLASLNGARKKSRDARRMADLKQLQLALELYYDSTNSVYPAALSSLAPTYIGSVPTDPGSGSPAYSYTSASPYSTYCLGATLETAPSASPSACTTGSANYKVSP